MSWLSWTNFGLAIFLIIWVYLIAEIEKSAHRIASVKPKNDAERERDKKYAEFVQEPPAQALWQRLILYLCVPLAIIRILFMWIMLSLLYIYSVILALFIKEDTPEFFAWMLPGT